MTNLINYEAVYRTAPAPPGLLNTFPTHCCREPSGIVLLPLGSLDHYVLEVVLHGPALVQVQVSLAGLQVLLCLDRCQ